MKRKDYTAEHVEMIIGNRCLDKDFPYLSDLLGSDWGSGLIFITPADYQAAAVSLAYKLYPSMWKKP